MGSVIIGTNKITNCRTLVSVKGDPLVRVETAPLRLSFRLPQDLPTGVFFEIVENEIIGDRPPELRVVQSSSNVSVLWREMLLLSATLLDETTAHLKIDLRPLGILIFDDHQGLHVGGNVLARSSFTDCMTAISLG